MWIKIYLAPSRWMNTSITLRRWTMNERAVSTWMLLNVVSQGHWDPKGPTGGRTDCQGGREQKTVARGNSWGIAEKERWKQTVVPKRWEPENCLPQAWILQVQHSFEGFSEQMVKASLEDLPTFNTIWHMVILPSKVRCIANLTPEVGMRILPEMI